MLLVSNQTEMNNSAFKSPSIFALDNCIPPLLLSSSFPVLKPLSFTNPNPPSQHVLHRPYVNLISYHPSHTPDVKYVITMCSMR